MPKIKILTVEKLLNSQERPEYCDINSGAQNFNKAKKESKQAKQEVLKGF